jgi:NADPH:quinone reductase-like Zn-dependent oxidoreductase
MGNDFAGTICAVGPGGDKSQIGKRIAGFLTGSRDDKIGGAFAEYLKVE